MTKIIGGIARFVAFVAFIALPLSAESSANNNTKGAKMTIEMSFGGDLGGEAQVRTIIELEDNPATRDFYAQLPLNLEFSDYVGKEKISNALPKPLNTSGLNGYDPQVGGFILFHSVGKSRDFLCKAAIS